MNYLQAIVLGMVQGITEFLPISSSAHLILVPWFFGWEEHGLAFDVFLHMGTLAAIVAYFFKDWLMLLRAGVQSIFERRIGFDTYRMLFWWIVIGTIPAVAAGLLFGEHVEATFRAPLLIAVFLAGVGFLIYWIDGHYSSLKSIEELRFQDAIWIGLAQACAIIPGVSRSGATMAAGRFGGLSREAAARFSFLLATPVTFGAAVFKFKDFAGTTVTSIPTAYLVASFLSSLICGFLTIHFLLQYLRRADFRVFAWYRLGLAVLIVACSVLWGLK